jgi:hypothetical protein
MGRTAKKDKELVEEIGKSLTVGNMYYVLLTSGNHFEGIYQGTRNGKFIFSSGGKEINVTINRIDLVKESDLER